jgi:hypothetical protein
MIAVGAPWGLLALAAIPAILAIHWFRRRAAPHRVSALFLWPAPAPVSASGRRPERIVNLPSLWLELLLALALVWWLADLHPSGDDAGRHLVIVLDDRLRLQAHLPAGDSPADRLRNELATRLHALGTADRVSLLASGSVPRLLAGPAASPVECAAALAKWVPESGWHDLEPALALAGQLAACGGTGEVLLASDRVPVDLPTGIGCVARGMPVPTSGLADARWLRDGQGERLVLRVYGPPRDIEIAVDQHTFARIPAVSGTVLVPLTTPPEAVRVVLAGADPLPQDDAVLLRRPPLRAVRVANQFPEPARAAAQRVLAALFAVEPGGPAPHLELTSTSGATPGAWQMQIAGGAGGAVLGPFLTRRGHPVARDLDGTGLLWAGAAERALLPADATEIISAGTQVLLSEQRHGRDRHFTCAVDPTRGTLLQHPLWPGLIANLVEARRAALPGVSQPAVPVGRPLSVVLPTDAEQVQLIGPTGISATLSADSDGAVLLPALDHAGTWRLEVAGRPWEQIEALPLDERLGELAGAATAERAGATPTLVAVARRRTAAELLLPLLLAAAAAAGAWLCAARGR